MPAYRYTLLSCHAAHEVLQIGDKWLFQRLSSDVGYTLRNQKFVSTRCIDPRLNRHGIGFQVSNTARKRRLWCETYHMSVEKNKLDSDPAATDGQVPDVPACASDDGGERRVQ